MTETRSLKDRVTGAALGRFLRRGTVTEVTDLADDLRRLEIATPTAVDWTPGQKVQVQVRGVQLRTFTPFAWTDSSVALLVFRHGASPADDWLARHDPGAEIAYLGPRRAVGLDDLAAPPIFVGDETSFALTAAWQHTAAAVPPAGQIYEVTDAGPAAAALDALGLGVAPATLVGRTADDGHHDELGEHVLRAVADHPGHPLVLTGKAQTIRAVRQAVKQSAPATAPTVRVKAHWDPRRSGLD
jgi:ferric-chelate reductase (NADPH)